MHSFRLIVLISLVILQSSKIFCCSSFMLQDDNNIVVGKNLDWFCNYAFITINKRNTIKKSYLALSMNYQFQWISKYGSVTFNPNGVGFPSGGMNEVGLVIEESWLGETEYPREDSRPVIDEIQWIQYQLDNCATVEEVIKTDSILRIVKYTGESHYFICDRSGTAATIEFIGGKMEYHILNKEQSQVLTNDPYKNSLEYLNAHIENGESKKIQNTGQSMDRFSWASKRIKDYKKSDAVSIQTSRKKTVK